MIPEVVKAITTAVQIDYLSNFVPKMEQVISKVVQIISSHNMTQKQ